jgi:uroporphyrin-III C-methyltransferase/precorrin-2 dehydrogenase/sirohydrochlorin ferrochelatase
MRLSGLAEIEPMPVSATKDAQKKSTPMRPERMQALATLPVFFKLDGKRAIVIGGSEPALWKAELLAAAGAHVEVYADAFTDGFDALVSEPPGGSIKLSRRSWTAADLAGAAIAIAASDSDAEAAAFAEAARAAGVPVNIVDRPAFCDFQFGAIVNRSPLVVGISTNGAVPVLGQTIRSLVEALLPDGLKRWVEAAKTWRTRGGQLGATPAARRQFWVRFVELAMRESQRPPREADFDELLRRPAETPRSVAIIDVGESADTLTLRALRVLRTADVIFFDDALPAAVLDFARREARRIPLHPGYEGEARRIVEAATSGARVVRLIAATSGQGEAVRDEIRLALRAAGSEPPEILLQVRGTENPR